VSVVFCPVRGLCDKLITRPEESYRLRCVMYDLETSWMRRPWPTGGCCATRRKKDDADVSKHVGVFTIYMRVCVCVCVYIYIYVRCAFLGLDNKIVSLSLAVRVQKKNCRITFRQIFLPS
jgi:hypothetical protein